MFIKCHLRPRENYGLLGDRRMWQKITFETASTPAAHIGTESFLSLHQKPFYILSIKEVCIRAVTHQPAQSRTSGENS